MLDGETLLESKGRPVRAEDILVLVRRRGTFRRGAGARAEEPRRSRCRRRPDGAGQADRGHGPRSPSAASSCFPEDDLTLACVLKSPLIGFDDDDLFDARP